MLSLSLDWETCPDGVELHHRPERRSKTITSSWPAATLFRPRSSRREARHYELTNLEDPIALAFINAGDNDALAQFFTRYGLPSRDEPTLPEVRKGQRALRWLLELAEDHHREAVDRINRTFGHPGFALAPTFNLGGPDGSLRMMFRPQSLRAFMFVECAQAVLEGAQLHECEQCGTAFLTGPLTGRRSSAKFCSDRCRVAAMRARQAATTE